MFTYNFKYELTSLLRSKWLVILAIILLIIVLFAGNNGQERVDKRLVDIQKITAKTNLEDQHTLQILDSIERGFTVTTDSWDLPNNPMNFAMENSRVAALYPNSFTFISVGQSDLFAHFVQPKIFGDNFAQNYSELSSPVQLLFGSFDLAFVIIYILPLLIIAFSYHILSEEKEYGSLKLLASQPISIFNWLLQKVGFRFFWLTLITLFVLSITFIVNGFDFSTNLSGFLSLLLLVTSYILFWFVIALLVNIYIGNSAKNAVSLLGIWVFIILLLPATISQLSNVFYPIPSRAKLLTEARKIKDEAEKKQDKILDNFLRDHPEYASKDGQTNYTFWHKYIASKKLVDEELSPLLESYNNQLQEQQKWIGNWQYVSPTIIMQQSFNNFAGTSTAHYQNYRTQVIEFSNTWKDFFIPLVYNNKNFKSSTYKDLPKFNYKPPKSASATINTIVILLFSGLIIGLSYLIFNKKKKKGTLID
ncbi:DUF3526 domain-containing protein [Polaribacter cellanae]|uniref:DUF3526 domain-containing protein n=1 Tax=Polaribacter cellanae TaxID=2818493 RepID=A0A975CME0_9FLAO|nr:DUF3526 domain-containing protein [Polaribacter cellanae]QTE21994.1 DUF3526 domain-containing protein [Polaribacter cellanae]